MTVPFRIDASSMASLVMAVGPFEGRLSGLTIERLPGVSPYVRRYHACLSDPEELAIFHDDLQHDMNTCRSLWLLAMEDLTTFQPSLF